jgi:uridine kinase
MRGDKLIIEGHHTDRAKDIVAHIREGLTERYTMTVAGESGSGKSELAAEIARILSEADIPAGILQQDDYFVFPPHTNHEMRRRNIDQVGLYEVKLDFLDSNLRSFKRGESPIYKPLVYFNEDRITVEEMDIERYQVLIAEGTYTSILQFVDARVFIDRDYTQTLEARKRRARDKLEPFIIDVLELEHRIISKHKELANIIIPPEFDRLVVKRP